MILEYLFEDGGVAEKVDHPLLHSLVLAGLAAVESRTKNAGRLGVPSVRIGSAFRELPIGSIPTCMVIVYGVSY